MFRVNYGNGQVSDSISLDACKRILLHERATHNFAYIQRYEGEVEWSTYKL